MSGLSEQEILTKHSQSLKEAKDACAWLAKNADPEWLAPRGRYYRMLKTALKELEGSARQMSMMRADARWTRLGMLYAKTMRTVERLFAKQNWLGFRDMMPLFDNGIKQMDVLANAKTGTVGPILPKRPSDWIIMPDYAPPRPRLWTPQGRLPN